MKLITKKSIHFLLGIMFLNLIPLTATQAAHKDELLKKEISLHANHKPLGTVLANMDEEYQIGFIYNNQLPGLKKYVSLRVSNLPLSSVLDRLLIPNNLNYKVVSGQIAIVPFKQETETNVINGSLKGTVTGLPDYMPLPYATVNFKGSDKYTLTNDQGQFFFPSVPTGSHTLQISYLGYESLEKQIEIISGETTELKVEMVSNMSELEGVTITGIRRGEVKALNSMKNAENIKYVMSQEQIERFPDLTVSESLQRVPGVAVGYSYGIPRDIIIRGLSQSLSSMTLNGTRLPSTGAGGRDTDLNGILANSIESIEVIKTLTPDRDADGTGGAVNIITKSPAKDEKLFDAKLAGGYNGLVNKATYDAGLTFGERKKKTSYIIGTSYSRNWRGEDRVEKDYDTYSVNGTESTYLSNLDLDGYEIKRDNLALNGEFKYYPNDRSELYLRGSYNLYYEIQNRLERIFNIGEYTSSDQVDNLRITQSGNWRDYHKNLLQASMGGKSYIGDMKLDYDLTLSQGKYDQPIYYSAAFVRDGLSAGLNLQNPITPQFEFSEADPYSPDLFTTNRYINRHDRSVDRDGQLTLNINKPYQLGRHKGNLKFGGRGKLKYNDRSRNYFLHDLNEGSFVLSDYLSDYKKDDHYEGAYNMGQFPEAEAMEAYYNQHPELFSDNETYTRQNTDPDSFEGSEYLAAAYVMTALNIDNLQIITGIRYEKTGFDYEGNRVNFDDQGNYVSTNPISTDRTFDGWFPSINLRYALGKGTNIRGAVTRSLSRPSYYDLVPWEEVETRRNRVKMGNPDLTQSTSINYDILFEHYFKSVGILSGGVFMKNINDYIYESSYIQEGGTYDGYTVNQTVNGANAIARGFELAWQQQLTFLPGIWNGLGIYANYTYVNSEFEIPGTQSTRTVKLPEMRPHVGNVSLSYEKFGFSGRLSMYFYGTFNSELAENPENDLQEKGRKQLDFSASQQLTDRLSLFIGVNNLTNEPISDIYRDGRRQNDAVYGRWGQLGLRFKTY
ncbi:TonB-dependent receptor [Echinicola sp. CAU 1574]|uniref:TonB-dependent receptor n=1 Tax=Echinicola arenosa TaxID=2774144 RepID=A0ABR9AK29_9BACT|nr:TonB-dependent receptor [Echinicola arenosa]MBD8489163.1 TonB-dependent receptor [Echinicola arenosa]